MLLVGDNMYKIEKLDHKGRGITFVDGKITFVEDALPNEIVDIKILQEKKKFNEAKMKSIIQPSEDRVIPKCPYYHECGGCDLMHLSYPKQLEYKMKKVTEILEKYGNVTKQIKEIIPSTEFYYRNKATFQVKENIGFYKKKSYDVIPIEKCMIVDEKINVLLKQIKNLDLSGIYQIVIRTSKYTDESMIIFKINNDLKIDMSQLNVTSIIMYQNNQYTTLKGKDYILEKLNDLGFMISPDSFFQVNSYGALKLYEKVLEYANLKGKEKVLDLFCGTGTIGLFLSRYCNHVIGVEWNQYAVEDAKKNAKLNDINNIEFICDDAVNVHFKNIDLVVVDPPRSGLNPGTIDYLLNLETKKIIYVSCDPMTLARDLKLMSEKYEVKNISLVDMFPNTYHVESIAVLHQKNY